MTRLFRRPHRLRNLSFPHYSHGHLWTNDANYYDDDDDGNKPAGFWDWDGQVFFMRK